MQRFHRSLRTEVAAPRTQIIIVQVPNHRGPGIVKHPLNHTRRFVLIPAVGLVHGTNAFVGHQLRLEGEILRAVGLPVAMSERLIKNLDSLELSAAGMEVPHVVDWPYMLFPPHAANALDGRNCWPHAGFRVEAVSPAAAARIALLTAGLALNRVLFPIGGGVGLLRAR